jgi:hypothetical protein
MRRATGITLALGVVTACGGRRGPSVTLRFHPPAGAVYHYGLEQKTQISIESGPLAGLGMGKQRLTMRMFFTQTVKGAAPEGGTEVEVVFENMTMEMPGVPADQIAGELSKMNGLRSTVVYDERGTIVRSNFTPPPGLDPAVVSQMQSGVQSITFGFPDHPVRQGDSWTFATDLPLGQIPGADASKAGSAKTTVTVREIRLAGADTSVVLDLKTEFPKGPINVASGGQSGVLKLDGSLAGHQQFSITRGAILDGMIAGSTRMSMTGGMLGAKGMDMTTETETSIFLLPGK